ncbi:hypothetical protein [Acidocella sp.]|uniref:hypothetical protein n=1 Tax=Acidocella sp. TaxID=50710 RepID=UPI003D07017B
MDIKPKDEGMTAPTPDELFQQSVVELRAKEPRKVRRVRSPTLRPMSDKVRAWNMSDANKAQLRANIEAAKAKRGGKLPTRMGVPDGWKGPQRRRKLAEIREQSHRRADDLLDALVTQGAIDLPDRHTALVGADGKLNEDMAARLALQVAISFVVARDAETGKYAYTLNDRLAAARLVLKYTKPRPEQKALRGGNAAERAEGFLTWLGACREPARNELAD